MPTGRAERVSVLGLCAVGSRLAEVKPLLDLIANDRRPKIVAAKDMKDNICSRSVNISAANETTFAISATEPTRAASRSRSSPRRCAPDSAAHWAAAFCSVMLLPL